MAGASGAVPVVLFAAYLLVAAPVVALGVSAPRLLLQDPLNSLVIVALLLAYGVPLFWAVTYRVWATPTHLVARSFGRVLAVRWEHVRTVDHMYSGPRLPNWVLVRAGYPAGGRRFGVVYELFRNHEELLAIIVARTLAASPAASVRSYVRLPEVDGNTTALPRPTPPTDLTRYEQPAQRRTDAADLRLGTSVRGWLVDGGGPGFGAFCLLVAELSLGPLAGAVGLYVLASRVRVSPAGVSVRAWGAVRTRGRLERPASPRPCLPQGPEVAHAARRARRQHLRRPLRPERGGGVPGRLRERGVAVRPTGGGGGRSGGSGRAHSGEGPLTATCSPGCRPSHTAPASGMLPVGDPEPRHPGPKETCT